MTKAVFFDWFNTLARFEPEREQLYAEAFSKLGVVIDTRTVMRGLLKADQVYYVEESKNPLINRAPEEQMKVYCLYPRSILDEAGIAVSPDTPQKVIMSLLEPFSKTTYVLFEDVLPVLRSLKEQDMILGILSNSKNTIIPLAKKLGLESLVDFYLTSEEAGFEKPHPEFFKLAIKMAGVAPEDALHVGDQYDLDVVGAAGIGIKPIYIDRWELYPEPVDCPRIASLSELERYT